MQTIYKYPLAVTDLQMVSLPTGARLLTVQVQGDGVAYSPMLWALIDTDTEETEVFVLKTFGTGQPIRSDPGQYLGTYHLDNGRLVFHVFWDN